MFPNADLNQFHAFPSERIKISGETLFVDAEFKPAVNFDFTHEAKREDTYPEIPYETPEPVEDELLLPKQFYEALRVDVLTHYNQRKTIHHFLDVEKVQASILADESDAESDEDDDAENESAKLEEVVAAEAETTVDAKDPSNLVAENQS